MRVMVLVKATEDSEKGFLPTPEAMEAMGSSCAVRLRTRDNEQATGVEGSQVD